MSALASFGNCGKVQGAYSRVIRAPETQVKDWTHVYVGVLGKGGLILTYVGGPGKKGRSHELLGLGDAGKNWTHGMWGF